AVLMRAELSKLLWLGTFLGFGLILSGQGFTASVLGTVTDTTAAVIPHAKVTVTSLGTGVENVIQTDTNGNYTVPLLPPGTYRVAGDMKGFVRSVRETVNLQVDQRQRLDFT